MISNVFFDLDGTLADTAPDLTAALNQVLQEQHKPTLTLAQVRPTISIGSDAIIKLAFSTIKDELEFEHTKQHFLEIYHQRSHQETHIFLGIETVLEYLEEEAITWGVVTNKPEWLTLPIMQKLQLTKRATCIISGDTIGFKKPDPQSILHACDVSQCDPKTSLYIGDALTDIKAGRAAGMKTLSADYGYISENEHPNEWGADGNISAPEQIIDWLKKENSQP